MLSVLLLLSSLLLFVDVVEVVVVVVWVFSVFVSVFFITFARFCAILKTRPVTVYRLVTDQTVEEKVLCASVVASSRDETRDLNMNIC